MDRTRLYIRRGPREAKGVSGLKGSGGGGKGRGIQEGEEGQGMDELGYQSTEHRGSWVGSSITTKQHHRALELVGHQEDFALSQDG